MTRLKAFFLNLFSINPIIVKEIRSRMRGPRAFITLTIMLLTMGGFMYAMLQLILANARYSNVLSPQIGQALFAALAFLELAMICAVTPAVTAGALSGEKERQTYEMLMATPLSATSILWGKLVSALSYVLLLLFAGIPLASVIFIFGGVAPRDMVKALVVLFGVAIAYGILGLFMSALFGRTGRATVATFITVVVLMIGPIFIAILVTVMRGNGEPPRWLLAPSPISALSAALASSMGNDAGGGVFSALGGIFNTGVNTVSQTSIPRPLYHYTLPFYTILSVVLYLLTTRLVQPTRRWRLRRKEVLVTVLTLVLVIGVFVGGYFVTAPKYEWFVIPIVPTPETTQGIFPGQAVPAVAVEKQVIELPTPTPVDPPSTPTVVSKTAQVATLTPSPTVVYRLPMTAQPPSFETIKEEEQAEIYAAVARQLYSVDHTFGSNNPPNWPGLYLISITKDGIGDPNEPKGDPIAFPKEMLDSIAKRLNDLPTKVMWIEGEGKVAKEPQTGALDSGKSAMITFGNLYLQQDGSVHVSASLYIGNLAATGKTYIVEKVNGVWKITGTSGVQWIS